MNDLSNKINYEREYLLINKLYKNKLITFDEWYSSLLKLMDKYDLPYVNDK